MNNRMPCVDQSLFYSNEGSVGKLFNDACPVVHQDDRRATLGSDKKRGSLFDGLKSESRSHSAHKANNDLSYHLAANPSSFWDMNGNMSSGHGIIDASQS